MTQVLRTVDKANGYCFGNLEERNLQAMMSAAVGADFQFTAYPLLTAAILIYVFVIKPVYSTCSTYETKPF